MIKKNKALIFSVFTMTVVSSCSSPGSTGVFGGNNFNLKSLIITKILTDKTSVSSTLKWTGISGADHYELSRVQDNGSEIIIKSIIPNNTLTYNDQNLKQDSSYKYVIRAVDVKNVLLKSETTESIKAISSTDLQAAQIEDLKPLPEINRITRETNLKWSSVNNADLYYPSIVNDAVGKQIFGIFTKNNTVNLNTVTSPENPADNVKLELPILTDGLAISLQHKFSVYTIKFNNKEMDKVTAIGIRQSPEVNIII